MALVQSSASRVRRVTPPNDPAVTEGRRAGRTRSGRIPRLNVLSASVPVERLRVMMDRYVRYVWLALAVGLQGCWIKWSIPPTPEQLAHQAKLREDAGRPVLSSGVDDCAMKWARALAWVHDHS